MKTPVKAKPAIARLAASTEYRKEKEVAVCDVWDVVTEDSGRNTRVLAPNLYGQEDVVKRFAQETFGWDHLSRWRLVPSKTKMAGLVDVKCLLRELNISEESLSAD